MTLTPQEMRDRAELYERGDWLADVRPNVQLATMLNAGADALEEVATLTERVTALEAELERAKVAYSGRGGRGPDDPAKCPFGHVDSCCGFHAECVAASDLEAQR